MVTVEKMQDALLCFSDYYNIYFLLSCTYMAIHFDLCASHTSKLINSRYESDKLYNIE